MLREDLDRGALNEMWRRSSLFNARLVVFHNLVGLTKGLLNG